MRSDDISRPAPHAVGDVKRCWMGRQRGETAPAHEHPTDVRALVAREDLGAHAGARGHQRAYVEHLDIAPIGRLNAPHPWQARRCR